MKKNKEVSDEDEYSADDPEEVGEEASDEDLEGAEVLTLLLKLLCHLLIIAINNLKKINNIFKLKNFLNSYFI